MDRKTEPPHLTVKCWPLFIDATGSHAINSIRRPIYIAIAAISIPLAVIAAERLYLLVWRLL